MCIYIIYMIIYVYSNEKTHSWVRQMRYPHASPFFQRVPFWQPENDPPSCADEDRIRDDHQSEEGFKLPSLHLFGGHFVGNLGSELFFG